MTKGRVDIAAIAATFAAFLFIGSVSAQYPPPKGGMVCIVNQINVKSESAVEITVVVRDSAGDAISQIDVYFNIVSQPGDASLESAVETTDGDGMASTKLFAGHKQGQIVVSASTSDDLECRVITEVLGEVRFFIQPPSTGDGGLIEAIPSIDVEKVVVLGITATAALGMIVILMMALRRPTTYR
jgi:hypothetical protein